MTTNAVATVADPQSGAHPVMSLRLRFLKVMEIKHVSRYVLFYIDRALEEAGIEPLENPQGRAETLLAKAVTRLQLTGNIKRASEGPVFVTCMSASNSQLLPFSYWTEIIPYCFDCWEPDYDLWKVFFLRHRVRLAFFSARQSAQHFASVLPEMRSEWLPEATDPSEYQPGKLLRDRNIDVLELGRRHEQFHASVTQTLQTTKLVHLFERTKGEIVFPDKDSFRYGLGSTKISVCFPCSHTHVERSGSIETVTHRYFESMASKCVLLGHSPAELTDLFGYNPVIEVEPGGEVAQIESILSNLDSFQNLVERNYTRLLEVGTWRTRISAVIKTVKEFETQSSPDTMPRIRKQ